MKPQLGCGSAGPKPRNARPALDQQADAEQLRGLHGDDRGHAPAARARRLTAQRAEAVDPGGVDVEPLADRLGDAEHDPVDGGGDQDAEDRHDQVDLDADDADDGEQQDRRGQRHDDLGEPAGHLLGPPAALGGDQRQRQADAEGDQHGERRDEQRLRAGGEDPAEQVAAERVGAQPVRAGRAAPGGWRGPARRPRRAATAAR